MNPYLRNKVLRISSLALLVGAISAAPVHAIPLYWVGDGALGLPANAGSGAWELSPSSMMWSSTEFTSTPVPWTQSSDAFFNGTVGGTVTIGENISVGTVTFGTGAGGFTIEDGGALNIAGGLVNNSTTSVQAISNLAGLLRLSGTATATPGLGITLANGGSFDMSSTPALPVGKTVALTSLSNSAPGGFDEDNNPINLGGSVALGKNTLTLNGGLTLGTAVNDELFFTLDTPATSGKIVITGGVFTDPDNVGKTTIDLTSLGPVLAGTYDLINFSGASGTSGLDLTNPYADFVLGSLPFNVASATLKYNVDQNILQLVAVPEPATLMMPMAAILGMAWLRRRTARMAR